MSYERFMNSCTRQLVKIIYYRIFFKKISLAITQVFKGQLELILVY